MHIGIFGISGTGKTTLTRKFLQGHPEFVGTSASSLIASAGNEIAYKSLNKEKIANNQDVLVVKYNEFIAMYPNSIIELHNVIEVDAGLSWIPSEVLLALNLDLIFYLYTEATEILKRRISDNTKSRKITTEKELYEIQNASLESLISVMGEKNVHILTGQEPIKQLDEILEAVTKSLI